jgi:ankyrin repeat protein
MGQVDSSLFDASKDGDFEKAKRALENGANVNAKDKNGQTPLHVARVRNMVLMLMPNMIMMD